MTVTSETPCHQEGYMDVGFTRVTLRCELIDGHKGKRHKVNVDGSNVLFVARKPPKEEKK